MRVRLSCLPDVRRGGRLDLAAIGANARRASEDSTTVGYIGETDPAATRFSETILEEANIAQLPHMSGAAAMHEAPEGHRRSRHRALAACGNRCVTSFSGDEGEGRATLSASPSEQVGQRAVDIRVKRNS